MQRIGLVFLFVLSSYVQSSLPGVGHAAENRWSSNGPFGAYILTFAFDPSNTNTVYAGGSDALYRSRNGGQTWERLAISGTTGFPAAFTVKFAPDNPSRMVAAGNSIFSSSNQGTFFQEISHAPAGGDQFFDIEFHPSNAQVLYGITYRRGFFRSNDGGRTWIARNSGLNINPRQACCDFPQVEVDPGNGSIVYALMSSRALYKSTNGGDTWKVLSSLRFSSQVNSLVIDPKTPQTIYAGGFEDIFKSTDGGNSWKGTNCCGIFSLAIDPKDSKVLYAVSDSAVKSTDGGGSWSALNAAPIPKNGSWLGVAVHPRSNQVFAGGFGSGVFRSLDGGRTWREFLQRLDGLYVENVESSQQRPPQLFGTSTTLGFSSANAGAAWSVMKTVPVNPRSIDTHPANANLVAAAGDPAGFALSADGGRTWVTRGPYRDVREFCTKCVQFHSQDQNTIYLAPLGSGGAAGMARSTDRGSNWSAINSGITDKNISVIGVDPRNGDNLFAGSTSGKVFRSTNAGGSWKSSNNGIAAGYVLAITIDPQNSNIAYLAADRQPDKAFVYKTTNGGQNWSQKSRGLDSRYAIRGFAVDPADSSVVYAAGEGGIFVSADGGENWSVFDSTGLAPFYIFDVHINPANPQTLWLATDRSAFQYTRKATSGGPVLNQVAPSAARTGETVMLQGRSFGGSQGGSAVTFNGVSGGTATSWSDSTIAIRVPSGARSGPVTVTVNNRRSNPFTFQVLASSGNIEPASGPAAGGTNVTILGPPAATRVLLAVTFGETLAKNVRFTPPNIYTCTAPPGSGTVQVKVVTGGTVATVGSYTYQ